MSSNKSNKLYLICNPITCSDIVNALISQRSYSTYFKDKDLNLSKVPTDNYVSNIGLVQINYLINAILNNTALDCIKDIDITGNVLTSISIGSLETALRVYGVIKTIGAESKIKIQPYVNNVVRNIDKKTLSIRNRRLLQKINNYKLKEGMIDFDAKIDMSKYTMVNISDFKKDMSKSIAGNRVLFCDYTFIRDLIKSINKDFGEDIEPTSIFEFDVNSTKFEYLKKIYPIYGVSSDYKMEGDFYTYAFNNKRLPLLPYWRSSGIQKRIIPFITKDIIKSCTGVDILEKYIEKYPYNKDKMNTKDNKNTYNIGGKIIHTNTSYERILIDLTK